jgi:hypothetical protein
VATGRLPLRPVRSTHGRRDVRLDDGPHVRCFQVCTGGLVVTRWAGVVVVRIALAPARTGSLGRRRRAAAVRVVHRRRRRLGYRGRSRGRSGCSRLRLCRCRRRSRRRRLTRRTTCRWRRWRGWLRVRSSRGRPVCGSRSGRNKRCETLWGDTRVDRQCARGTTRRGMRGDDPRRDPWRDRHRRCRRGWSECLLSHHRRVFRRLQRCAPEVAGGHRCTAECNEAQ